MRRFASAWQRWSRHTIAPTRFSNFERDEWLDPLRRDPRFIAALARARVRHEDAARKFRDAGGERLLPTA